MPDMRVLIMCDMEGVSGIINWDQVNGGAPMYQEGRELYTEEVMAAVRGAKEAGAKEIHVVDCHGAGGGVDVQLVYSGADGPGVSVGERACVVEICRHV